MEENGRRSRFGFNIQPDLREYEKKEPEPVEVEGSAQEAEPVDKGEKIGDLLKDATTGMANAALDLVIYVLVWYCCYPFLLFTTFIMSQRYLNMKMTAFTTIDMLNAIITLSAGTYYAYHLLANFINEHSAPNTYADEKRFFLSRIGFYALCMAFVLYTTGLLNLETFQNQHNVGLFVVFYLIYVLAVTLFRYFNAKVSRPR